MMNKAVIMKRAHEIFKKNKGKISFGEALHRSWNVEKMADENIQLIANAKAMSGVEEECNTWYGWKKAGYEVIHESKCVFQVKLHNESKGDGVMYTASFFTASQVAPIAA